MPTVNPYLNTPPTKLNRMIPNASGEKKKLMQEALAAWREVHGNPLAKSASRVAEAWLNRKFSVNSD